MNVYDSENIRNVVLLGHGGSGKTILLEGLAYAAGMINRIRTIEEGGTISDYDKEEMKRHFSIQTSVVPIEYDGIKINILDTPGFFDFSGEVYEALSVADSAIICISGTDGIQVGTIKAFEYCREYHIPCMVFVSNIDSEKADFMAIIEDLKAEFEKRNPTETEKLNLRSQSSFPYSVKPKDYWNNKSQDGNYNVIYDNGVDPNKEDKEYVLKQKDIDNAASDDRSTYKTFDIPKQLTDYFDLF